MKTRAMAGSNRMAGVLGMAGRKLLTAAMLMTTATASVALADDISHAERWRDDDQIRLGEPNYGGSGCPAGTASATLSPDATSLSILFDQYIVEAGAMTGRNMDRKSCNVAIPVHVPQGYSVSIFQVDYRGFSSLPSGAQARFNVEYFFAGSRGPRATRMFRGPADADYLIQNAIPVEALVWSPCGADVTLRANSSMYVRTNRYGDDAMATVDSADVSAGVVFHVQWRRCGGGSMW